MKRIYKLLGLAIIFVSFSLHAYEYELSVLAIFRDEADYLEEWIEFHEYNGVEHFLLYDHLSTDDYLKVLQPYIDRGLVELRHWEDPTWPQAQIDAYKEGIKKMMGVTKWLAIIDIDEFIVINDEGNIGGFLNKYQDHAGVAINWQIFGTSGYQSLPKGEWITNQLTLKAPHDYRSFWGANHFLKSIVRPDRINVDSTHKNVGNHIFMPLHPYRMVDENGNPLGMQTTSPYVSTEKAQINHYWFRTLDWFFNFKIARREAAGYHYTPEEIDQMLCECNQIKDYRIKKKTPQKGFASQSLGTDHRKMTILNFFRLGR